MSILASLRRGQAAPAQHAPEPVTTQPGGGPLPVAWGLLDNVPDPRTPDPIVFGWRPTGEPRSWAMRTCNGCDCAQAHVPSLAMPCWQCGRPVTN